MRGTVSIIIPVYNEKKYIYKTIKEVLLSNTLGLIKEIIVIDDGSTDGTLNKLRYFKSRIKIIVNKNNQGKGAAIKSGLKIASGDVIVIQDADLEYSPKDYPALIDPFRDKKVNVVYGSRILGMSKFHNSYSGLVFFIGGQIVTIIVNFLYGLHLTDQPTGYKIFRKKYISSLIKKSLDNGFSYEIAMTSIFARSKTLIKEVPISYKPRHISDGKKINFHDFIKSVYLALKYKFLSR
jgi:glycosyltransferase involved in cell wall biosynthesis